MCMCMVVCVCVRYTHTHTTIHTYTHEIPTMFTSHYSTQRFYDSHLTVFFPPVTVQKTICSNTRPCSPDDGHNDARNTLRQKFDNKHRISCILLVYLSSPLVLSVFWKKKKNCLENSNFHKIVQKQQGTLHMKTNIHFWLYLAQFFLQRINVSDIGYRENRNTNYIFKKNFSFFRKSCLL